LSANPVPASATAWWNLFDLFLFFAVIGGGIVVGLMIYLVLKYRCREGQVQIVAKSTSPRHHVRDAILLAMLSGILLFSLSIVSYRVAFSDRYPQLAYTQNSASLYVQVTAFQWDFSFKYPNNVTTVGECRVPSGSTVLFNVTSTDVFHNFGLPDFKLKIDAMPGMYNTIWITAPPLNGQTELHYPIYCYELCGEGHTQMHATLTVMDPNAFTQWLDQAKMNMNQTGGS
jgi:cytochrome c oxidase subunit 2